MNHTFTQMPVGKKQHLSPQKPNLPEKSNNGGDAENYLFLVVVLDILLLNLCLFGFLAMMIPADTLFDPALAKPLKNFGILANVIWLVIVPFTNVYRAFEGIKLRLKTRELFLSTLIYFGIINWVYYPYFLSVFQVHFLLPAVLTFFVLATILHYVVRYYTRNLALDLSYAVVGGGSANIQYLEKVLNSAYGDQAYCMGRFAQDEIPGVNRLGTYEDIEEYLRKNSNINKLLYFYSDLSKQTVQRIIQLCRSRFIDFDIVPTGVDFFERGVQVE